MFPKLPTDETLSYSQTSIESYFLYFLYATQIALVRPNVNCVCYVFLINLSVLFLVGNI